MKILSNKEYETIIEATKYTAYADGKRDGYLKGYKNGKIEGYKEGHKSGLNQGMTTDKTGIVMNGAGLYHFKDGVTTGINVSHEQTNNAIEEI